ncbi:MAG: hypothetical protein QGF53_01065 [Alphaproteobacteria bacterium]|jgi:hypothetical protein|nr:hypothetical protein [Alphaproteobacteria bacterium]
MADPLPRRRDYGPRGCLLTLAAMAAIVLVLEFAIGWSDRLGPGVERIQSVANEKVRRQLIEEDIAAITVRGVHPRRKRFTLLTERWAVEGDVIMAGAEGRRVPYLALLHMTCSDAFDRRCWVLEQLTYGTHIMRLEGEAGSVID